MFITEFGQWLRHKVRVIIIKQWKRPRTIYKNLQKINKSYKCNFNEESIYKVANSILGWYRRCGMNIINYILSPKVLAQANKKKGRSGLANLWITTLVVFNQYRCSAVYETRTYGATGGAKNSFLYPISNIIV